MSITRSETQQTRPVSGVLSLRGAHETLNDRLQREGFAVVPNVISSAAAKEYADRMLSWLEGFELGFKADDRSTWIPENLPAFLKGGIFTRHGCGQEQFAWDIRGEPEVIKVFAEIWGTEDLLVSVDAVNVSLPFDKSVCPDVDTAAWPHVDQSPLRRFKHCVQGIMNLHENGPNDGGLMVLEGSIPLYNEFFETHDPPEGGWTPNDSHGFSEADMQWFYDRGCKWKKVNAHPGDVILWDSRCVRYGAGAEGTEPRIATYICYKPAKDISPEKAQERREVMENYDVTTHDPLLFQRVGTRRFGKLTENERDAPSKPPVLTHRMKQLAGLEPYGAPSK